MVLLRVPKEKRAKTISAEEWVRLPYGRQLAGGWCIVWKQAYCWYLLGYIFQTRAEVYIGYYMLAWRNGSASDL